MKNLETEYIGKTREAIEAKLYDQFLNAPKRLGKDRIEVIYDALDQIYRVHGQPRPERFGGGIWNYNEEIRIWRKQVIRGEAKYEKNRATGGEYHIPLSPLQWSIINKYISLKRKELKKQGRLLTNRTK